MNAFLIAFLSLMSTTVLPAVDLDIEAFGESLGGWKKSRVDYSLSGSLYRTHKPDITPTPDGGIFVSVRIDHRRGWLASDDHAMLEVAYAEDGSVVSAQTTLAIQGRTIASDLIRTSAEAGASVTGIEGAVQIGTNLVADLSSKMLREKIVEAGRVSFPSAVRHNYNLLFRAVRAHPGDLEGDQPVAEGGESAAAEDEEVETSAAEAETEDKLSPDLEIRPYGIKPGKN
jgi:hypothetical protein